VAAWLFGVDEGGGGDWRNGSGGAERVGEAEESRAVAGNESDGLAVGKVARAGHKIAEAAFVTIDVNEAAIAFSTDDLIEIMPRSGIEIEIDSKGIVFRTGLTVDACGRPGTVRCPDGYLRRRLKPTLLKKAS
jgi:hypothetical protein